MARAMAKGRLLVLAFEVGKRIKNSRITPPTGKKYILAFSTLELKSLANFDASYSRSTALTRPPTDVNVSPIRLDTCLISLFSGYKIGCFGRYFRYYGDI